MKTLAIVDDNLMMREFLINYFSKQYHVIAYESGEEMIRNLKQSKNPDAILLDYDLDGMNGHQVLDNIKSSEFHKEVPVLLLSGHKQSDTRISCLKSGAQDFVLKPFNPLELDLKIQKLMSV
jgi:DNA-binding response OmpR family regulator